jgi:hypothetical protein
MGGIWSKAIEHLMQNGRVLRDAPLVIVAAILLAFALAFWVDGLRYQGTLDAKTATIETLNGQLTGLNTQVTALAASVKDLETKLAAKPIQAEPQRDPEAIYQFGSNVARTIGGYVDRAAGLVRFQQVLGGPNFNVKAAMDYMQFVLNNCQLPMMSQRKTNGVVMEQAYPNLVCQISGLRPSASASQ